MFNYSPLLLSGTLDFDVIRNKISQLGVKPGQVIFILDDAPKKKWQFENIRKAHESGFGIAVYNITDKKTLELVKPT